MALGTGSIRFSQIVSEFGGVSPHRFSEYKSLSGLGVSGVPASGSMRFSQFRGKSNQVSTQVWVSSGYNQTTLTLLKSINEGWQRSSDIGFNRLYTYNNYGTAYNYSINMGHVSSYSVGGTVNGQSTTIYLYNGGQQRRYRSKSGKYTYYYRLDMKYNRTDWIDTSHYETQITTAQIST